MLNSIAKKKILGKNNSKERQVTALLKMCSFIHLTLKELDTQEPFAVAKEDPITTCKSIDPTSALVDLSCASLS